VNESFPHFYHTFQNNRIFPLFTVPPSGSCGNPVFRHGSGKILKQTAKERKSVSPFCSLTFIKIILAMFVKFRFGLDEFVGDIIGLVVDNVVMVEACWVLDVFLG